MASTQAAPFLIGDTLRAFIIHDTAKYLSRWWGVRQALTTDDLDDYIERILELDDAFTHHTR